jgi:guanylate kinase
MSRLIVVSAPSGAGKTTLCQRLLRDFSQLRLSVSCTTRAPRGQEKHGQDYFFLSKDEFKAKIAAGDFAEWAEVHGNFYGTLKSTIEQNLRAGLSVLLDIDVQGAASLRKAFPKEAVTIFVSPPSLDELEKRLRSRGTDSEESVARRMANARREMQEAPHFDRVILNDQLERAYSELHTFIRKAIEEGDSHG